MVAKTTIVNDIIKRKQGRYLIIVLMDIFKIHLIIHVLIQFVKSLSTIELHFMGNIMKLLTGII